MNMKTEDIDSKIGMPDIDMEWAKFEAEVINNKPVTVKLPLFRRTAAAVTILIGLSCLAVASVWVGKQINTVTSENENTASTITATETKTYNSVEAESAPEVFLFDNVEVLEIANTLGKYYGLEPVFENEEVKHVRMYLQIEKEKTIEQIVEMLNNFKKVNFRLDGKRLIIK